MKAIYRENGIPPTIMTPGRRNAYQGGVVLVELFAEQDFADLVTITTDWIGDGFTPVLNILAVKWFPQYNGATLQVELNVDLEEAFGGDNMTNGTLRQIVNDFKETVYARIEARERG